MDQSGRSVGVDYISLYQFTSLLMHAIGPKVRINRGITHTFCLREFLRVQNRACLGGIS